jgi:outer membrane protein OmpA-like peptidoglycan-associated protein
LSIAVGSSIDPTASATGLIDGDALGNVSFDVYQGATLLNAMPTTPGTYKIVPKDASLQAADMSAYTNTIKYVAGKLIITQLPPVITTVAPSHGPEAGGTVVTITGEKLDTVTSITFGSKTLRKPTFTVNGDGTQITFKTAAGKGQVDLILHAGSATADSTYTYDAPPVVAVTAPLSLSLELKLVVGAKFEGQDVTIQGGGLKPNSDYTLVLHSTAVVVYQGIADADGNFLQVVKMPAKACVEAGTHTLTLTGIKPNGQSTSAVASFQLASNCIVGTGAAVKNIKKGKVTWTLSGFLFKYRDAALTADGLKSLDALIKNIKGAKVVTIYGYTETDTTSAVIKKANLILASARTASVKAYLKSKGINAVYRLFGKGGVNPVSLTDQSKNRRVVIDATF